MTEHISIKVANSLKNIEAEHWNTLNIERQPFLSYAFLSGLEEYNCIGEHVGWHPHHFLAFNQSDELIAAMPCYKKDNSFGEFVFDWQWASAYEQAGLEYYPKLVCSVPFSPITGMRMLSKHINDSNLYAAFHSALLDTIEKQSYSSAHILFLPKTQKDVFEQHNMLSRLGYQYHWHNQSYTDFDNFLAGFSSKKRRNVKRERRLASSIENISIEQHYGDTLDDEEWQTIYQCYQNTFHDKGNYPSLTFAFFKHLAKTIDKQVVVFIARQEGNIVAASICFRSDDTLYGRYWGCLQNFDCLHFELCFYRGIEYCIEHKLQCFEPGAQGEHKITRGFLPQETWSSHHIAHPGFKKGVENFLQREKEYMQKDVLDHLNKLSPYK